MANRKRKAVRIIVETKQGKVGTRAVTYQLERVKCGKPQCGRCPHGPYWYAWWRGRQRGLFGPARVHKLYIGKAWRALTPADASRIENPVLGNKRRRKPSPKKRKAA